MTAEELCVELACPPETPAGGLLAAWERRRAELDAQLNDAAFARPVKLRLREERRRLDDAAVLAEGLKQASEADAYLAELANESAKSAPSGAVLRLCAEKARPVISAIAEPALRFAYEKRLAELEELVAASAAAAKSAAVDASSPPRPNCENITPAVLHSPTLDLIPLLTGETLRTPLARTRFITSETFSIGRQAGADCVLRYALDTEENRRRLSTISRIHTRLTSRGGRLLVADGPSRNGTVIDEQRLDASEGVPLNFAKERRFTLGQFGFEVRVQYFNDGFVRFLLPPTADRSVNPIWLLTAATIGSAPACAVRVDGASSVAPVSARIRCDVAQGFVLEIPATDTAKNHVPGVSLDGADLAPGMAIRLQPSQRLKVGNATFIVQIT